MKRIRVVLASAIVLSTFSSLAQNSESLFDGKSLAGWKAGENPGSFKVVDGAIVCDGPRSHLFFVGPDGRADFKNFELSVEAMTKNGANSGVYFHTAFQSNGWPDLGFEAQVLNRRNGEGGYIENKLTGSLYCIRNIYKPLVKDGEWFKLTITVRGKRIEIRVNGELAVDYLEPAAAPEVPEHPGRKLGHGTFALQCHDPASQVRYRNIQVKRLPDGASETGGPALSDYEKELLRLGAENYPVVNYHAHLKGGLTLEEALAASRQTGVFCGIAVNCGLNFAVTNDAGIDACLKSLQGRPAYVAMQAEGREWVHLFSRDAVRRFDYVFTDGMTIFDDQGRRMRLWITNEVPEIKDPQAFMDMLVNRTVSILEKEPIDILVNPTFLPDQIAADYDRLWTPARMNKVIEAAAKRGVAIEINSRYRLPSPAFLKLAKRAGCKFTFGTNNPDRDLGRLDYCLEMVKELGLRWQDIWVPK
jgi:hypothetical protein